MRGVIQEAENDLREEIRRHTHPINDIRNAIARLEGTVAEIQEDTQVMRARLENLFTDHNINAHNTGAIHTEVAAIRATANRLQEEQQELPRFINVVRLGQTQHNQAIERLREECTQHAQTLEAVTEMIQGLDGRLHVSRPASPVESGRCGPYTLNTAWDHLGPKTIHHKTCVPYLQQMLALLPLRYQKYPGVLG